MEGIWQLVLYLHLLAMAFFVGGQLLIAAAVVPVERANPDRARMRGIARRFGYGSVVALLVLLATGIAMASHLDLWGLRDAADQARAGRARPGPDGRAPALSASPRTAGADLCLHLGDRLVRGGLSELT
jgi:hypothetical protein